MNLIMTTSSPLIESLLYQSEGTALDFKCEQYKFTNHATEEQKSELLKDVLAFVNSFRQSDAYIVIGVKANIGVKHDLIHIEDDDHFDDAQLQQFINSKTNRPVEMAYEVHHHEGKNIGVIRIAKQERPIYAKKDFGKVKKAVVYYRLGSSTAVADPDDIVKMGRDIVPSISSPSMTLQFADLESHQELGLGINLRSIAFIKPYHSFPDLEEEQHRIGSIMLPSLDQLNRDYWREKEEFIRINSLCQPVGLVIYNQSNILAEQVRIEVKGSFTDGIYITDKLPNKPMKKGLMAMPNIRSLNSMIAISDYGNHWSMIINFGNVQPKSSIWLDKPFYLGSKKIEHLELDALIFANNIPEPQKVKLTVNFEVESRETLTMSDL